MDLKVTKVEANQSDLIIRKILSELNISHMDAIKVLAQTGIFMYGYLLRKDLEEEMDKILKDTFVETEQTVHSGLFLLTELSHRLMNQGKVVEKRESHT